MITRADNTIKIIRTVRCKNENVHAALKQKFQIFDSTVPLSVLEPLVEGSNVSRYSAIAAVCCSLLNIEHPGFPVNFLREEQKIPKATQMLLNFNTENFLQHITLNFNWAEVRADSIPDDLYFPTLTPSVFDQIYEITSSIHALVKGQGTGSNIRRREVLASHPDNISEFKELLRLPPENIRVRFFRLNNPTAEYTEKERAGILPPWPGSGVIFQLVCYPSNRSNNVRGNWKWPTVFVLDSDTPNPLNCSDIFRCIGAITCQNCPSVNGSLGGCCHIGFMLLLLSAPWILESRNTAVKLVNIKNPSFMHPAEVMAGINSHRGFSSFNVRQSYDKRGNSALLRPEEIFESDSSETQYDDNGSASQPHGETSSQHHEDSEFQDNVQPCDASQHSAQQPTPHDPAPSPAAQQPDPSPAAQQQSQSRSQASSATYGQSRSNIENLIRRAVRRNPSRAIPEASQIQGIYFLNKYHRSSIDSALSYLPNFKEIIIDLCIALYFRSKLHEDIPSTGTYKFRIVVLFK